jgi:hypothetical protein|tara:strand:+ start:635 stop:1210 length:576 start_codon:yes stop_codon:yes gene_type:complete
MAPFLDLQSNTSWPGTGNNQVKGLQDALKTVDPITQVTLQIGLGRYAAGGSNAMKRATSGMTLNLFFVDNYFNGQKQFESKKSMNDNKPAYVLRYGDNDAWEIMSWNIRSHVMTGTTGPDALTILPRNQWLGIGGLNNGSKEGHMFSVGDFNVYSGGTGGSDNTPWTRLHSHPWGPGFSAGTAIITGVTFS